ncbi:hypothetical protein GCM10017750_01610 [Streptomyces racemochromogenes]
MPRGEPRHHGWERRSREVADVDESRRAWVMIGGVITVVLLDLVAIILMNTLGR